MKSWLTLSFLILFSTFSSFGQDHKSDVYLTGAIIGLSAVAECSGAVGRILVQVELSMQFRNGGDRPLIILKPNSAWPAVFGGTVGSTQVVFLRTLPSTTDKESERVPVPDTLLDDCRRSRSMYSRSYDPVNAFIARIDRPTPASEYCVVIEPRGYYEFREIVTLDTGYEVDVKVGKSLREARLRSEYPAFQIQYQISLKGHEKGEGLLQRLQSKWKNIGNFFLDGNGDFTVLSEPITNRTSD